MARTKAARVFGKWYVDCEPYTRLYIGPRGGIREEKF